MSEIVSWYIIESLIIISCVVVFGGYLSKYIEMRNSDCIFEYNDGEVLGIICLGGILLVVGVVTFVVNICGLFQLKNEKRQN